MKRVVVVLAAFVMAGCAQLGLRGGPDPADYFSGADLELASAVKAGDQLKIDAALASGADVEATGARDLTMLQWAVMANSVAGVTVLMGAGADPDRTGYGQDAALHMAVGKRPLTQALLDGGADPDVRNAVTGSGPLTNVCLVNTDEVDDSFELLTSAGADIAMRDVLGELALHTCARTNQGGLILRMLELGVDPTAGNNHGDTFQDYYFGYDPTLLNDRAVEERRQIVGWLVGHGFEIVLEAEQFR